MVVGCAGRSCRYRTTRSIRRRICASGSSCLLGVAVGHLAGARASILGDTWIGSNRTCLQGEIAEHQRKIHVPFKIFMQVPENSLSFVRFCCFTGNEVDLKDMFTDWEGALICCQTTNLPQRRLL
ncbi:unnamed protein product [Urochloa humidicola]